MTWVHAAFWGLFGSFAVEGLDLWFAVRRWGVWPWRVRGRREVGALGYFVAELIRLAIGGGLAWAALSSGQITTPVAALAVGIAAPLIVERLTRSVTLTDSAQDTMGGEKQSVLPPSALQRRPDQTTVGERPSVLAGNELDGRRAPAKEQCSPNEIRETTSEADRPGRVRE